MWCRFPPTVSYRGCVGREFLAGQWRQRTRSHAGFRVAVYIRDEFPLSYLFPPTLFWDIGRMGRGEDGFATVPYPLHHKSGYIRD